MSSVLRTVKKRKKSRRLGEVEIIRREEYAELELDSKVEAIRALIPLGSTPPMFFRPYRRYPGGSRFTHCISFYSENSTRIVKYTSTGAPFSLLIREMPSRMPG